MSDTDTAPVAPAAQDHGTSSPSVMVEFTFIPAADKVAARCIYTIQLGAAVNEDARWHLVGAAWRAFRMAAMGSNPLVVEYAPFRRAGTIEVSMHADANSTAIQAWFETCNRVIARATQGVPGFSMSEVRFVPSVPAPPTPAA